MPDAPMSSSAGSNAGAHPRSGRRSAVRWLVACAWSAVLACLAAAPVAGQAPRGGALTGQLLVAADDMPDPRFARTVVYMVRHDATGAQGFVVNRPLREIPLGALMDQMGLPGAGVPGRVRLHAGGPVESFGVFALHTDDWRAAGTRAVPGGYAVTAQSEVLSAIAAGQGPRRVLFLLGYAGWAPGQLEEEMKGGQWLKAGPDEAIVFDPAYDTKWERARARQKIDL